MLVWLCFNIAYAEHVDLILPCQAYHGGYSQGYNCCEAVNFAKADWLRWGRLLDSASIVPNYVSVTIVLFARCLLAGYKAMSDYRLQCRPVSLDQVKLILEIASDEVRGGEVFGCYTILSTCCTSQAKRSILVDTLPLLKSIIEKHRQLRTHILTSVGLVLQEGAAPSLHTIQHTAHHCHTAHSTQHITARVL